MKLSGIVEKTCISVSDVDSVDSDFGHGTDHPFSDRKHWRQPDRYRSDPYFLSGGGQYTGWFEIGTAGKIRIDVFLRGEPQNNL